MANILTFNNWTKTINRTCLDFKQFSLNGLIGGGCNEGSPISQLKCFGKPDHFVNGSLCYFDLGLEFLPSVDNRIAYIYIYCQPSNRSVNSFDDLSSNFSSFSGDLIYGKRLIDFSELQDCHALIQSFNDLRFKLYDTTVYSDSKNHKSIAYIEEMNGIRKRTVVFEYKEGCIDRIILL